MTKTRSTTAPKKMSRAIKIVLVAVFALFASAQQARAGFISDLVTWGVGVAAYSINYLAVTFWGIAIAIETWFIEVVLQMNDNIVGGAVVSHGFAVTLSLANLGFVLGIIIIALATILRRETYGVKQILWKLVVMAILVNFGLVIAGQVIGFTNSITRTFMAAFPGQGGGSEFASRMTSAFQPQRFLAPESDPNTSEVELVNDENSALSGISSIANDLGSTLGGTAAAVASVIFLNINMFFIVVVLAAFVVMLLIRYVMLSILLVLLPLAWLTWVFPNLSSNWNKWWSMFLRWTFFAPIVVFFIWLVIQTGDAIRGATPLSPFSGIAVDFSSTSTSPLLAAISNFFGTAITPVVKTSLDSLVLMGLTVGGIFAASSMSITGASAAMSAVKGAGGWARGYAGRRGRQAATAPLRSKEARDRFQRWQQPHRNIVTKWAGRIGEGLAVAGGERTLEAAKKHEGVGNLTDNQLMGRISTAEGPYGRMAVLEEALKRDKLKEVPGWDKHIGDDKETEFGRYGQGELYKELRDKSGITLHNLTKERSGITEDTTTTADERKKRLTENREKIETYNTRMAATSPETLASNFQDHAKEREKLVKDGRPIPAVLEEGSIRNMQETIVGSFAKGFSPHNARALIDEISKKNNLQHFESSIERMKTENKEGFDEIRDDMKKNKNLVNWTDKNAGKTLIDFRKLFELGEKPKEDQA